MANLQSIEQQITAEFGVVIGTIKNHAVLCVIGALLVGAFLGHVL